MIRKISNMSVDSAKSKIEELDGFKIGDEIWAHLREGTVGHGKISEFHESPSEKSATFYDEVGEKYRSVLVSDLSREELKKLRKTRAPREDLGAIRIRMISDAKVT